MKTKIDPQRARLIKLIHVARRELGMDDESYRQMLANMPALGGRTSSADVGIKGLELILNQMKAKGFKVRTKSTKNIPQHSRALAEDAQSKKIRSLWLELHTLGAVRDPSEAAMASYVCRITKIEALQWLSTENATQVIETLKKWRQRTIKKGEQKIGSSMPNE